MANDFQKFDLAERAEKLAEDLYRLLAGKFAGDEPVRALFERLAMEEKQHAIRIGMLRKQYVASQVEEVQLDVTDLRRYIAEGEAYKVDLAGGATPSLTDALAAMADLETKFAGVHAQMMLSATDPGLKTFFAQFAAQDKGHAAFIRSQAH
jgi:rubrerythrin